MSTNTQKKSFDHITPQQFGDMFFGREDERKATCIHCGDIWYAKHYKDGVCHSCQQKKLPGETQLIKSAVTKRKIILIVILIISIVLIINMTRWNHYWINYSLVGIQQAFFK